MIYHVTTKHSWQKAQEQGAYEALSLFTEGFIHLSKKEQVAGVLERYYKDQTDLLLLHVDETKLDALLKYEVSPSVNEEFPHLFGKLNLDAVVKTEEIKSKN
ncbi:MAG: DUF952 domain-containing protein [Ferruginibacter sp.]